MTFRYLEFLMKFDERFEWLHENECLNIGNQTERQLKALTFCYFWLPHHIFNWYLNETWSVEFLSYLFQIILIIKIPLFYFIININLKMCVFKMIFCYWNNNHIIRPYFVKKLILFSGSKNIACHWFCEMLSEYYYYFMIITTWQEM